jgi:nicotinate-nucleotide adenylyltransferase
LNRFGFLGGTFNPPHIAHTIIAEDIRGQFLLDKIIFIPSGNPPLKTVKTVISAKHRLNMLKLAIGGNKNFEISELEISNNKEKSYTVDTLLKLTELYKKKNIKFYLILGIDAVIDFPRWKNPEILFDLSEIIVVNRPGSFKNKIKKKYLQRLKFAKVPLLEISSSMVREYIKKGKSIKYLVHPKVENYILKNKLYI